MLYDQSRRKRTDRKWIAVVVASLLSLVGACAAVGPALTSLAAAFAQDLLAAVSVNYTPRYALQVEELLVALAAEGSNLPLKPQLADSGYRPPPPDYMRQDPPPPGYGGTYQDPYGQGTYQEPYGQNQQGTYEDSYGDQQGPYQDPYAQDQGPYEDAYAQDPYQDPYAQDEGPYQDPHQDPYSQNQQDTSNPGYAYGGVRTRSANDPISMNAVLVAQKAGSDRLVTVEDGQVLQDGRGDPARGDRLKVQFQINCACYVYVIGIDATGYVANIFPDPDDRGLGNPAEAETQYVLPRGDDWWGLDDYRGIEQMYFVASRAPRQDLEAAMAKLGNQPRHIPADDYRPVNEPAVIPTRGIVKVSAPRQIELDTGSSNDQITAASFEAAQGNDLVVTRWFRHE